MIKQSFTLRVLVVSFLVLALPLLIDSFEFFQDSYFDSINDAKIKLRELANFRSFVLSQVQPVKQTLLREVDYLLDLGNLESLDKEKLNRQLAEIAHMSGEIQVFVLDLGDNSRYDLIASSFEAQKDSFFTSYVSLQQVEKTGEGSFIRYHYLEEEKKYVPYVFIAHLITSKKTNQSLGFLMIVAPIESELKEVQQSGKEFENVSFALLNADGVVFSSSNQNLVGQYFDPLPSTRRKEILETGELGLAKIAKTQLPIIQGNDPPFFEFIFDSQVQIAYRAYVPTMGGSVIAFASKEEFFGKAVRHFLFIYSMYGLILVVGGGVTYWLSLWISRPLRQLSHLMEEVGKGNLDVRFKEQPLGFEINILGQIFNNTIDNLLENIQQAEDERVKKETYQKELLIARQVQKNLIPEKMPDVEGMELAGKYIQAQEVRGDFYGVTKQRLKSGEEVLMLALADSVGKGISSSLYSLSARSLLRTYFTLFDNVGEILSSTNNAFLEDVGESGVFITAFFGMYHIDSKILTYYSCGHVPGIIRRSDGHLETLTHTGLALGLRESKPFTPDSIQLYSGDIVVLYTDGLIEAVNEKNQHFTDRRLRKSLQTREWKTAQEVVDGITKDLDSFIQSVQQEDEVIIVALKIK